MTKETFIITLITLFSLGFGSKSEAQTVSNNFEDGNWLYYNNLCWGISPNDNQFYTKVTGNGFNGTDVCETDNLAQHSPCNLVSPWIMMNGNDNISFTHALTNFSGVRSLKVFLISYPSLAEELVYTYNYTDANPHSGSITHTKSGNYKVKWQWSGTDGNSIGQLDNIVIGGTYNSDPSNGCQPLPDPIVDTDLDGVPDAQDAYPTDKYRAYNSLYPASDTSTLVFEDLWPSYGDYDLNDLVVGYKFQVVSNSQQQVVEIFATFVLKASGASIQSGFGFSLPNVNPASIIAATGYDIQPASFYSLGANGTENDQTWATMIVFDKARRFIVHGNTSPDYPAEPYKRFNIYMKFMENGISGPGGVVSINTLNIHGFNPFLISGTVRGKEVHLPGYPPSSLANPALFGTEDDDSNPGNGKYYQSATYLPWALDISSEFAYPKEKITISDCYLKFLQWAQSSGNQFPDWYMNKSGYRNAQNIY